jgi:hypothetical protein
MAGVGMRCFCEASHWYILVRERRRLKKIVWNTACDGTTRQVTFDMAPVQLDNLNSIGYEYPKGILYYFLWVVHYSYFRRKTSPIDETFLWLTGSWSNLVFVAHPFPCSFGQNAKNSLLWTPTISIKPQFPPSTDIWLWYVLLSYWFWHHRKPRETVTGVDGPNITAKSSPLKIRISLSFTIIRCDKPSTLEQPEICYILNTGILGLKKTGCYYMV